MPLDSFVLPEGLEIVAWAASPMLFNPTNMDSDQHGRIWVTEGVNYRGKKDRRPEGDRMRMWLKFTEKDGKKVIDRASFQAFGCQTAIAVASVATKLLQGKTTEEARHLSAQDLAGDLGTLPPMKIHCGQLVEGALRNALDPTDSPAPKPQNSLIGEIQSAKPQGIRIVPITD